MEHMYVFLNFIRKLFHIDKDCSSIIRGYRTAAYIQMIKELRVKQICK